MNISKHKTGFSLIEVLVSTALFAIIITAAMSIFQLVVRSQRIAVATQNVEESLKYFLEVTGKEIRMAKRNNSLCALPPTSIYATNVVSSTSDNLVFRNYHDNCVTYGLAYDSASGVTRFAITRDSATNFITPAKINVDELHFVINSAATQPTVTMELVAHAIGQDIDKSTMRIQTTLSSRYYKLD
jgi:prepilin-type N-terminal cleavage/methylation domain-containing protein